MLNLNCVICAELFSHSDDVHVTTCGHMFHFICLRQWMERSKSCPQCRNKCTDRNIFRVYFNLANLDVSSIDVGSLQDQLDNANLQMKIKEKDIKRADEQIKSLKETQKKCMKTITGLEQTVQKKEFLILSYTEQLKLMKVDAKQMEELRKEIKSLKQQIEAMEGLSMIFTASTADAEKMLKNENDPKKLCIIATTLNKELRHCQSKKTDLGNTLKTAQHDLREALKLKKQQEERISELESENYFLNKKIKAMESSYSNAKARRNSDISAEIDLTKSHATAISGLERRLTISPTVEETVRKIEDSNSPYLNIKSSSVGLASLFKRNNEALRGTLSGIAQSVSPIKKSTSTGNGVVRGTTSDLSDKYSIFKKPRLTTLPMRTKSGSAKALAPNFVFNGFGGTERVNPFEISSDEESAEVDALRKLQKPNSAATQSKKISLSSRLKAGNLRNFKESK